MIDRWLRTSQTHHIWSRTLVLACYKGPFRYNRSDTVLASRTGVLKTQVNFHLKFPWLSLPLSAIELYV
jgi:hypothetical protein